MATEPIDEAASLEQVKRGGLPIRAERRLAEARTAEGSGFFTSTLSVREGLLAKAAGYEPIGQVMGSSIYHLGWRAMLGTTSGEATALTAAHLDARDRALQRLDQEAAALGAHAVVGVKLTLRGYEWSGGSIEFTAIGTAVRIRGREAPARPALSLLDADQLWKAHLAGWWPIGIAMGNCCWQESHADCTSEGNWWNQELPVHNKVAKSVQRLAIERFRAAVAKTGAVGVVGVKLERRWHDSHWGDKDKHTQVSMEWLLLGTAVVRVPKPEGERKTLLVLDLRDRAKQANVEIEGGAPAVEGESPAEVGKKMANEKQPSDLPQHARERLGQLRSAGGPQKLFTSDLTVSEFLLVRESGFEPIGLVMGSSIYHTGYQKGKWSQNQEMDVLTQAMYHARELAMARMEEEADALQADGIIGVRLEVKRHEWGENMLEFLAIGTAVGHASGESWRTPKGKPFTSDLSGQDFWTLLQSGYRPVSLVMGNCVYHVAHQSFGSWFKTVAQNTEMPNFTQALYEARELAMERMQAEAIADGATGVVGTVIHETSHGGWDAHVMEFFAVGTAVLHYAADRPLKTPALVLTVNG